MSSGDEVAKIYSWQDPESGGARFGVRVGGSTKAERFPHFKFDDGSTHVNTAIDGHIRVLGYDNSSGFNVSGFVRATSGTSGAVRVAVGIRRMAAGNASGDDQDASHTYAFEEATVNVANTAGVPMQFSVNLAHNSNAADGLLDDEEAWIRIERRTSHGDDTLVGNAEISPSVMIKQQ